MDTIKQLLDKAGITVEQFLALTWDGFVQELTFATKRFEQKVLIWENKCHAAFDYSGVKTKDLLGKATAGYKIDAQRSIRELSDKACQELLGNANKPYTFMVDKLEITDPNKAKNDLQTQMKIVFAGCSTLKEAEKLAAEVGLPSVPSFVTERFSK